MRAHISFLFIPEVGVKQSVERRIREKSVLTMVNGKCLDQKGKFQPLKLEAEVEIKPWLKV